MWYGYKLDQNLISEPIKSGSGPFERESVFVTLPENDTYPEGYGFFLSFKLLSWGNTISIPDDLKVNLQMSPSRRVPGRRYKRYKLIGQQLVETVLEPHRQSVEAQEKAEQVRLDKKNRKIVGDVVWGWYRGNRYTDAADATPDCFFYNGNRYYNGKREKVANVTTHVVIARGVSKYAFDQLKDAIRKRMSDWKELCVAIEALYRISCPVAGIPAVIAELESAKQCILAELGAKLKTIE